MEKNNQNKDFLQSREWRKFQEVVGRKTHSSKGGDFSASIVEHVLPIVGKYFYCPRGPIVATSDKGQVTRGMQELIDLAEKENAGWIRLEPENDGTLNLIKENIDCKIVRAPHDMQPRELFVLDISKNAEQMLTEMKPKTRYNIGVAKKKGVKIFHIDKGCHPELDSGSTQIPGQARNDTMRARNDKEFYIEEFLKLTKEMASRHGITAHPENYYRKMIESLPSEMLKIYVAEFEGKIIAANLVLFYGQTATYLHGASGNLHRNLMTPFLLQWQTILDAKEKGFAKYDFGGISTNYESNTNVRITNKNSSLSGVTDFKMGFSPKTKPVEFPGTYDIIVNPRMYAVYRGLQRAKAFTKFFKR